MTIKQVISFWGVPVFAGILGSLPIGATAAELSVYAPGGVRSAVEGAAAAFARRTDHTIKFTFDTGGGIQKQIAAGAPADVTVLPSKGISELEKNGLTALDSRLEVGSVGGGIGIKAGTPRPKIGTLEDFRETLLAAKSITYAD
ncbi:MAG: substrate-binding domain-containing protein, partial [Syntrophales bacterium]